MLYTFVTLILPCMFGIIVAIYLRQISSKIFIIYILVQKLRMVFFNATCSNVFRETVLWFSELEPIQT